MPTTVIQIALFVTVPAAAHWACARSRALALLSPVVCCYLFGIAIGNQPWVVLDDRAAQGVASGTVLLAIALLLVSTDLRAWLRLARVTLVAAGLALLAAVLASAGAAFLFHDRVADSWQIAGMLVGVYTGGTPNMAAIATALQVDPSTFVMVHTSDIAVGGPYLVFLLLLAGRVYGLVLPPFTPASATASTAGAAAAQDQGTVSRARPLDVIRALGLGLLIVAVGGGLSQLVPRGAAEAVAILGVTSLALALSFHPGVRGMRATFAAGDYLLLIFCVAVGSMARADKLLDTPPALFLYTATVVMGSAALHLLLCRLARVDRDTCVITSTAALYGPAFVGPVAASLKNKEIVVSGITSGLVGLAVGNYLGLMVAYGLRGILG